MDFNIELKHKTDDFLKKLETFLPEKDGKNDILIDAMHYSLFAGGKRIRPILMEQVYKSLGGDKAEIYSFMAAIEMIHTYSLIHDDLPAMDNDDLRRGKPTCHIKYGENIAILAGDALQNRAYEIMISEAARNNSIKVIRAIKELAYSAGSNGMIIGQIADVMNEDKAMDMELLEYINKNKTSALIEAAFVIGAILAEAKEEDVEVLRSIGRDIGLAFQIQDDVLDILGDERKLGKTVHSDEKNKKTTFATLLGIEEASRLATEKLEDAHNKIKAYISGDKDFLSMFIDYIKNRNY